MDDSLNQTKSSAGDAKNDASEKSAHFFAFTAEKAGMAKVDQRKANQVIYEMSKDSRYFKNAQRNDTATQKRIKEMQHRVSLLTKNQFKVAVRKVDKQVQTLIEERNWNRTWVVVDMDMFFAAVEMRDNPSLKGKPVAVGGMSMISTANYEARKYGVRSAMPGFIARKLCPELVFVHSSFDKYKQVAQQTREVFALFDPNFSPASLDEAYLDITDYLKQRPNVTANEAVSHLRALIRKRTRLTCSAGIAPLPMLAKICSDVNKPNGQFWLREKEENDPTSSPDFDPALGISCPSAVMDFLHSLKVRKIPGIGKVTEKLLEDGLGVKTVNDLWAARYKVPHLFSPKSTAFFLRVCVGATSCEKDNLYAFGNESSNKADVQSAGNGSLLLAFQATSSGANGPCNAAHKQSASDIARGRKSISQERTFRDCSSPTALESKLREICGSLCENVQEVQGLVGGRTLTIKLKESTFRVRSRAISLATCVGHNAEELFENALPVLKGEMPCCLRLLGVRISALEFGTRMSGEDSLSSHQTNKAKTPKQVYMDKYLLQSCTRQKDVMKLEIKHKLEAQQRKPKSAFDSTTRIASKRHENLLPQQKGAKRKCMGETVTEMKMGTQQEREPNSQTPHRKNEKPADSQLKLEHFKNKTSKHNTCKLDTQRTNSVCLIDCDDDDVIVIDDTNNNIQSVICPVCRNTLNVDNQNEEYVSAQLNAHLDICLKQPL